MIPLEQVKVASPCSASWEAMEGSEKSRFCQGCRKNVYNLSGMTQTEAERLITRMEGRLCVRFYTRSDGTILTQDCPVGLRAVRKRLAARLSYAAALLLTCWAGLLRPGQSATSSPPASDARMGQIATPAPPPTVTMGAPLEVVPPPPHHLMGKIAVRPHHLPAKPPRVKRPRTGKTQP